MGGIVIVEGNLEVDVYDIDSDLERDMNHLFDDVCSSQKKDLLVDGTVGNADNNNTPSSPVSLLIPLGHLVLYLLPIYAILTTLQGISSDPKRVIDYFAVNTHCPLLTQTIFRLGQGSLGGNNKSHHHIHDDDDYSSYCRAEDSFLKLLLGDMWVRTASQDSWSLFLKTFQDSWIAFPLYLVLLPTLLALPYALMVIFLRHAESRLLVTSPALNNHHYNKAARFLNGFLHIAFEFPFGMLRSVCLWSWWGLVTMPYSYCSSLRRAFLRPMGSNGTTADPNTMTTPSGMVISLWTKGWATMYEVIATMTFTSLLCRVVRLGSMFGWSVLIPHDKDRNHHSHNYSGGSSLLHYLSTTTNYNYKSFFQGNQWKEDHIDDSVCWGPTIGEMMIRFKQTMAGHIGALVHFTQQEYNNNDNNSKLRMVLGVMGGVLGITFLVWLPGIMLGTITWMIRTWRRWRLRQEQRQKTMGSSSSS
jgi:hypothetical protein